MRGRFSYLTRPDKACQLSPHPPQCAHWGTCPYPLCPFGTTSLPLLAFGHFPLTGGISPLTRGVGPLWGECFGAVQIGRDSFFCRTFGYIYWELWRSAPVGGGRPGVPLLRSADSYRSGFCPLIRPLRGHLPPEGKVYGAHTVRPYGLFTNGSTYRKRDRSGTCPLKHKGETQFRIKFLCLLSFSKKVSYSRMAPRSAEDTILA